MSGGPITPVYLVHAGEAEEIEPLFDPAQFIALAKAISHIIDNLWNQDDKESILAAEKLRLMIDEDPERYEEAFVQYCEDCTAAAELSGNMTLQTVPSDFHENARRLMGRIFLIDATIDNRSARFLHKLFRMIGSELQQLEKRLNDERPSSGLVKAFGSLNPLRFLAAKKPAIAPVNLGIVFMARERIARILELCANARDHNYRYSLKKPEYNAIIPGGLSEPQGRRDSVRFLD